MNVLKEEFDRGGIEDMCWIHKWKYIGPYLRTCVKCGLHQAHRSDYAFEGWEDVECEQFAKEVEEWKEELKYREKLKRERAECKYHKQMS